MFLDKKKIIVTISGILCFISALITLVNFLTLFKTITVLPFSLPRVVGSILWIGDGYGVIVFIFIIISLGSVIAAGIDLLKFKRYIIFPFFAGCLYIFDLFLIVVPNYFDGNFVFLECVITDFIMIAVLTLAIIVKRKLILDSNSRNSIEEKP